MGDIDEVSEKLGKIQVGVEYMKDRLDTHLDDHRRLRDDVDSIKIWISKAKVWVAILAAAVSTFAHVIVQKLGLLLS